MTTKTRRLKIVNGIINGKKKYKKRSWDELSATTQYSLWLAGDPRAPVGWEPIRGKSQNPDK